MIAALMLLTMQPAVSVPVIETPAVTKPSAAQPSISQGLLVGCMFPDQGATKEHAAFSGIGIYLPSGKAEGVLDATLVRDPYGMLQAGGFDRASSKDGLIEFTGTNKMTLTAAGGGMFDAELNAGASSRTGMCQVASTESREKAFEFFDGFAREMKNPEGDKK